ncbi:MAG: DUF2062 domain-containing protein [Alphaproteobacteria bacterium]|nr:DUF2062 domain-containing protein [Alphaproteobacteria bacterium]
MTAPKADEDSQIGTMLFKRKKPASIWHTLSNLIWPKMGWRRTFDYVRHRVLRINDSDHSIALGLTAGCAVSWTPTFGFHLLQTALFCWITRTNWLASFVGSAFGNFWTTPFLMWIAFEVGTFTLNILGFNQVIGALPDIISFKDIMNHPAAIFIPTLVGGYICAILTFPTFYYPFYYLVKGARAARIRRLEIKAHKASLEITQRQDP